MGPQPTGYNRHLESGKPLLRPEKKLRYSGMTDGVSSALSHRSRIWPVQQTLSRYPLYSCDAVLGGPSAIYWAQVPVWRCRFRREALAPTSQGRPAIQGVPRATSVPTVRSEKRRGELGLAPFLPLYLDMVFCPGSGTWGL